MLFMLQNDIYLKNLIESWPVHLTIENLKQPIIDTLITYEIYNSHVYFIHSILSDSSKRKITLADMSQFILLMNSDLSKRTNFRNTLKIKDIMRELDSLSSDELFTILTSLTNDDEKPDFCKVYLSKEKDNTYVTIGDLSHEFIYKEALLKGNNSDECNTIMRNQFLKILNEDKRLNNHDDEEIIEIDELATLSSNNTVDDIIQSITHKNRLVLIEKNDLFTKMADKSIKYIDAKLEQFLNYNNENPENHNFKLRIDVSVPPINYELNTAIHVLEELGLKKMYEPTNFTFSTKLTNEVGKLYIKKVLEGLKYSLTEREIILETSNIIIDPID